MRARDERGILSLQEVSSISEVGLTVNLEVRQ